MKVLWLMVLVLTASALASYFFDPWLFGQLGIKAQPQNYYLVKGATEAIMFCVGYYLGSNEKVK